MASIAYYWQIMDRVKFYKCSKEEYERITKEGLINPYAFYFVVDDPALYIGQEKVLTERQEKEYKEI